MSNWSLEKELCQLANTTILSIALYKLGLIENLGDDFSIRGDPNWVRGGNETYIYKFWISHQDGHELGYIFKACVVFSPGIDLDTIIKEWINRRNLLSNYGVSTPKLISYGNGVLLEEFIPYKVTDILFDNSNLLGDILLKLASLAGILSRLGFAPINIFGDLYSRGEDVVIVDFGKDLGSPGISVDSDAHIYHALLNQIEKWGLLLTNELSDKLYKAFLVTRK